MLSNIKGKRDGNGCYRGPECLKHFVSCYWVGFQLTEKSRQRTKKLTGTLVLQDRVSQLLSCNLLIYSTLFTIFSLIQATLGNLTITDFTLSQDVTVSSYFTLFFCQNLGADKVFFIRDSKSYTYLVFPHHIFSSENLQSWTKNHSL